MSRVSFPFIGLIESVAAQDQESGGSFSLQNVRPFDIAEDRIRGGQRPGLVLAYTTRIVGDYPIMDISEIVTTYIVPGT